MTLAVNYEDVLAQLMAAGLVIDKELALDARIQRWKTDGKGREKNGWSRLREWTSKAGNVYIVGVFGAWQGNDDGRIKVSLPKLGDGRPKLSDEDIAAMRAAQKAAAKKLDEERRLEAKTAARWAAGVWDRAAPCAAHEYTTRKQIQPHGLRVLETLDGLVLAGVDESNWYRLTVAIGALVVPMHDANANVCGIQFIYPRGHERAKKIERDKEFWPAGMAMGGTFGLIGRVNRSGLLLVTEGYATAASLYEATGQSVAYAFSANNLAKAAKQLRKVYPRLRLLFCADDDYVGKCAACGAFTPVITPACAHCGQPHLKENAGVTAAANATAEIERCAWVKPDFADEAGNDRRNGKKLTDYNDLAVLTGLPLVLANQINAKLDELKWRDAQSAAGGSATGGGGDDAGGKNSRRAAVAVMTVNELVARFVPLDDGTGKYLFDSWTNKVAHRDQMFALLPAGAKSDDIKRDPLWVSRGAYYLDQVGFDPSGTDENVKLNTWRGWPLKPKAGKCELLLDLLRYLCSGDPNGEQIYRWILCWMAYPLQHPGAKMSSAIIMHGPQGTGKSTVFQTLAKIYGDYSTVLNQRGLEDKFNADWSDSKLFILAEEVVTRQEMWRIKNELKELVTGEWIRVNPKNIAAYRQRNQVNIVYLSNENQPLPLDNDDRRHLVVYTPPALAEAYFDEVYLELEAGGVGAFYDYLLNYDTAGFHSKKKPPMTEAKTALMLLASPTEQRFVLDWLEGELGLPVCPALAMDVYTAYQRWCRKNGEIRPRPSNQFLGTVARMDGWAKAKARIYASARYEGTTAPKSLLIPPPKTLQAAGRERTPETPLMQWYTDGVMDFSMALRQGEDETGGKWG